MSKVLARLLLVLTAFFIVGMTPQCDAAKKTVAVMPFESISDRDAYRAAEILTEQMTYAIHNSGNYIVLERNQLGQTIRELGFQQTGIVDADQAVELGKMAGAQYSLIGKVMMASLSENVAATAADRGSRSLFGNSQLGGMLSRIGGKLIGHYKATVSMEFRFIDNKTGEIMLVKTVKAEGADDNRETAVHEACENVAKKAFEMIQGINPFTATIIDVDGDTVYIDQGMDSGLQEKETLVVVKEGAPIMKDGRIIAVKHITLGSVRIDEVNSDYSIGHIVDRIGGNVISAGALVKRGGKK